MSDLSLSVPPAPAPFWRPAFSWRAVLAGFAVGSFVSWSAGIWVAIGNQRDLANGQTELRQRVEHLQAADAEIRATMIEWRRVRDVDVGAMKERIANLEARIGTYTANAEELRAIDRHLSAIDGRQDGIDSRSKALEEQMSGLRSRVDALLAASGRRR